MSTKTAWSLHTHRVGGEVVTRCRHSTRRQRACQLVGVAGVERLHMSRWRQRECTGSGLAHSVDSAFTLVLAMRTREERRAQDDINDATGWRSAGSWLIRASCVGPRPGYARLLRTRKQLVARRPAYPAAAEDARRRNIKLMVVADIVGKRERYDALIAGESDPASWRSCRHQIGARRTSSARRYPEGSGAPRFMLNSTSNRSTPRCSDHEIDREVDATWRLSHGVELLTSIPGISTLSAQVILSEIGTTERFPTAGI